MGRARESEAGFGPGAGDPRQRGVLGRPAQANGGTISGRESSLFRGLRHHFRASAARRSAPDPRPFGCGETASDIGPAHDFDDGVTPGRSARPSHAARRPAGSAGRLGCGSDGVGHLGSPLTSGRTNIEHHPALGKKLSASGVRPPGLLGTARTRERRLTAGPGR